MTRIYRRGGVAVAFSALTLAGTVGVVSATTPPSTEPTGTDMMGSEPMGTDMMGSEPMGTDMMAMVRPTGPLCAAVPADGEGSAAGMADDPVATAASNNPLLSTLVAAVTAAGLGDTLNGEGPFTVFAPINSAFDKIDPATLEGLLADTDALTSILTYHVLGEQLSGSDLVEGGTFTTVNGADLTVAMVGETLVINGGASAVQCADVSTANATVYLIDTVLMPPAAEGPTETTEAAADTTDGDVATTDGDSATTDSDVAATDGDVATTTGAVETTTPAVETTMPAVETTTPAVETTTPAVETTAAA